MTHNKNILLSLALLIAALITLSACTKGKTVPYKIACERDAEPFAYFDPNGNLTGFEVELIQAIADDQDIIIDLFPRHFEYIIDDMIHYKPQFDGAIALITKTYTRREYFDFSDGYFNSGIGLAVKKGAPKVTSIDDLKGKKVTLKEGTFLHNYAQMIQDTIGFELLTYPLVDDAFQAILDGKADVILEELPLIEHRIKKGMSIDLSYEGVRNQVFGFIVEHPHNPSLLSAFNEGLKNIKEDGTYDALYNKYFSADE